MIRSTISGRIAPFLLIAILGAGAAYGQGFVQVGPPRVTWDRLYQGTRAEALGQADLAAGGPSAGLLNPAPLPQMQGLAADYGRLEYVSGIRFHHAGLAATLGDFRLAVVRMGLGSDDQVGRTAYNPEGSGETFRLDDRVVVVSGSVDVAALLAPDRGWNWTVGFAHRRYRFGSIGEVGHESGIDFGSSARRVAEFDAGRLTVDAAGVITNVADSDVVPHLVRFGGAVQVAFDGQDSRDVVTMRVALAWTDDLDDPEYFDDGRWGAELVLMRALAVRVGHHDGLFGGSQRFGAGLAVPPRWLAGWSVTLDWSNVGRGEITVSDDDFTAWSLGVSAPLWGGVVRGAATP